MRQARGKIDQLSGYFHVENSLRPDVGSFIEDDVGPFRAILFAELERAGLLPVLEVFHPRGFGLLLQKPAVTGTDGDGQPSACIKSIKQRITRLYNRRSGHTGPIWQDRTKLFHLPETSDARTEVAAYILARPYIECGDSPPDWPSTLSDARRGDPPARAALGRLTGRDRWDPTLPGKLEQQRDTLLQMCRQPLPPKGRGRPAEWRPACERRGPARAAVPPRDPREYRKVRETARRHFFSMLDRYQRFCRKQGLTQIPRGFPGEPELREWAARQRGEFQRGRLPDWKRTALRGTTVLDAPQSPKPAFEDPWRLPTHLL
jgi:hypothetical protein